MLRAWSFLARRPMWPSLPWCLLGTSPLFGWGLVAVKLLGAGSALQELLRMCALLLSEPRGCWLEGGQATSVLMCFDVRSAPLCKCPRCCLGGGQRASACCVQTLPVVAVPFIFTVRRASVPSTMASCECLQRADPSRGGHAIYPHCAAGERSIHHGLMKTCCPHNVLYVFKN